jgi:hypothetical protein
MRHHAGLPILLVPLSALSPNHGRIEGNRSTPARLRPEQGEQVMSQATDLPRQSFGQECLEPVLEGAPASKVPSLLEEFAHGACSPPRVGDGAQARLRWRGSHPKVADHIEECLTCLASRSLTAGASAPPTVRRGSTRN